MVSSVWLYLGLLALLALERLFELLLSRRNSARALAGGGEETGQAHFRVMGAMHAAFLASCALEVLLLHRPFPGALGYAAVGGALAAQGLRYWAILTLGERWNVRVIVVPGDVPVECGPYRYLRHPNYLAVIVEIALIPLIHGAWLTAIIFTALNAAVLAVRIRAEERALGGSYAVAFARRSRLLPFRRE